MPPKKRNTSHYILVTSQRLHYTETCSKQTFCHHLHLKKDSSQLWNRESPPSSTSPHVVPERARSPRPLRFRNVCSYSHPHESQTNLVPSKVYSCVRSKRTNMLGFSTLKLNPSYTLLPLTTTLTLSLPCLWKEPALLEPQALHLQRTIFSKLNLLDCWSQRKQASSRHLGVISPKARRQVGCTLVSSPKGTLTHSTAVAPLTPADPLSIHYYQPSTTTNHPISIFMKNVNNYYTGDSLCLHIKDLWPIVRETV